MDVRRRRSFPNVADLPAIAADEVSWVSVEQMREVDRLATDEFGVLLEQMMENAGRNLAGAARELLGGSLAGRRIVVLARPGGNGGAASSLHAT